MIYDNTHLVIPQKSQIFGSRKSPISVLLTPGILPLIGWFSSTTHTTNQRLVEFRCLKKPIYIDSHTELTSFVLIQELI